MSRFFIDRPIFAWVIAIIIMLAGGLALTQLPIYEAALDLCERTGTPVPWLQP